MILIDFVPGSHGNFLETVLNGIVYDTRFDSFNNLGTSHKKPYDLFFGKFYADHYSFCVEPMEEFDINDFEGVIRIGAEVDDLAKLQFLAYTRVGDAGLDFDDLDNLTKIFKNTSNDLKNDDTTHPVYRQFVQHLARWNETSNDKFDVNACREMLKLSFGENNGLLENRYVYPDDLKILEFPFKAFYDLKLFIKHVESVLERFDIKKQIPYFVIEQYETFLSLNKAKDVTALPLNYFDELKKQNDISIVGMNIYQEAYLDHLYEKHYSVESLFYHPGGKYFSTTGEILQYVRSKRGH